MRCGVGVQTWGQKSIKFLYVRRSRQLEGFCAELGVEARCYNLSPSSTSSTAQICYITWLLKGYRMISLPGPLTCVLVKPCFGSPVHFITKGQAFFFFSSSPAIPSVFASLTLFTHRQFNYWYLLNTCYISSPGKGEMSTAQFWPQRHKCSR